MEFDRSRLMNNITTLIKEKNIKIGELENSVGISTGYLSKMAKPENESMPGIDLIWKLAEKLGVSHRHLGDLERGSSNGSVKILIDIAEYFHVSMDYLLLGRDPSRDQFQNELQAAIDHLEKIKGLL